MNHVAPIRDHGGGLDAAIARHGGKRADWLDLSTGINPVPYPLGDVSPDAWTGLPDQCAFDRLERSARQFWAVPDAAAVLAAPGASALIARIPSLFAAGRVVISGPTYNEHAAAFQAQGWRVNEDGTGDARVMVHPNNPDGRRWTLPELNQPLTVIDESFCDVTPNASHIQLTTKPGVLILKSFGKFWGLAGLRLGFVIGDATLIARLREAIGPWQVSGPALEIGARALGDRDWADRTRARLAEDAARLDALLIGKGAELVGGTSLFRLYDVDDATAWQTRLARAHIWSRVFPYSDRWLRLGLPPATGWAQLERAL
ncbi:threonine-phosphate decarboxylase [Aliiroseovarius zhejiangensis]|uniref:Aminotransferase n=1 Tax=Aliiroseovarius zhejiangensis TaxID=1632025 RepID=A0ABQ3J4X3_9RHOB|nr:threonine-phosphate decarboxylase [Aliiroseovarius zhejiangensis]GHF04963.1 threonine-phosphate decarboxylase [Aliiroseovarius zhejiangensis]